jgi:hypothetical protein
MPQWALQGERRPLLSSRPWEEGGDADSLAFMMSLLQQSRSPRSWRGLAGERRRVVPRRPYAIGAVG